MNKKETERQEHRKMNLITWFKGKVILPREPYLKDHYYTDSDEYIPYDNKDQNLGIDRINRTITLIPASDSIPRTYEYVVID